MRCTVRGLRTTCSACSWSTVRVYCSIARVSRPSRTTNCPLWAVSVAGQASATAQNMGSLRSMAMASSRRGSRCGSLHSNRFDFVVLRNLVHDVLPLGDLSENGVDSVKVGLRRVADEELAAAGVLPGVRHRERAGDVLVDVLVGLALDRVAGAAGADASLPGLRVGIAALDHEVGDHPVERRPVVEARVRELFEVGHCVRHLVGEQLQLDRALHGLDDGVFVGHQEPVSKERFSSTCATVFIPTSTTETASLSSTNWSASCAAVTPADSANSCTRRPSAATCATYGRGMRARMSPRSHVLSGP